MTGPVVSFGCIFPTFLSKRVQLQSHTGD